MPWMIRRRPKTMPRCEAPVRARTAHTQWKIAPRTRCEPKDRNSWPIRKRRAEARAWESQGRGATLAARQPADLYPNARSAGATTEDASTVSSVSPSSGWWIVGTSAILPSPNRIRKMADNGCYVTYVNLHRQAVFTLSPYAPMPRPAIPGRCRRSACRGTR